MSSHDKAGSFKNRGNGYISEPSNQEAELRKKQKQSIAKEFNQPDPVGDAVRSLWKKVRGK